MMDAALNRVRKTLILKSWMLRCMSKRRRTREKSKETEEKRRRYLFRCGGMYMNGRVVMVIRIPRHRTKWNVRSTCLWSGWNRQHFDSNSWTHTSLCIRKSTTLQIKPPWCTFMVLPDVVRPCLQLQLEVSSTHRTVLRLSAPEVVSWRSVIRTQHRALFKEAKCAPSLCLLTRSMRLLETYDSGMDRRIVSQLLTEMDKIGEEEDEMRTTTRTSRQRQRKMVRKSHLPENENDKTVVLQRRTKSKRTRQQRNLVLFLWLVRITHSLTQPTN